MVVQMMIMMTAIAAKLITWTIKACELFYAPVVQTSADIITAARNRDDHPPVGIAILNPST